MTRSIRSEMGEQAKSINYTFYADFKDLDSLEGAPLAIDGEFYCSNNKLTSLEGGPSFVNGCVFCSDNNFTSLHNIHKQIKQISGYIDFSKNQITSCVLGLLLIDGLKEVFLDHKQIQYLINMHLKNGKDIFECQEELIEAGLDEYAQL